MSFRIQARTILQLGAELISSDGIAFYELIKNAVDARSPAIDIAVAFPLPDEVYTAGEKLLFSNSGNTARSFRELKRELSDLVVPYGFDLDHFDGCEDHDALRNEFESLNSITFNDTGHGMSLADLSEVFLTIGTRSRQRHRSEPIEPGERPLLGEKGIGRLSSMRLGDRLSVQSSKEGELYWNVLEIDWRIFSHDSDVLLQDVNIAPRRGTRKSSPSESGTIITISALKADWTEDKLRDIAVTDFSRLTDPFARALRFPITVSFNGNRVPIRSINRDLLDAAHARCAGSFTVDKRRRRCEVRGLTTYTLRGEQREFHYRGIDLESISGTADLDVLLSLGSFDFEWYWFNRRILVAVEGIGDRKAVSKLVEQWGGGVMLFRDGFRVNPYGDKDDDWLELDPSALASSGYKVNRRQIIGRVNITTNGNPVLIDQTNREGLRDCPEKFAMVEMLNSLLTVEFRGFLTRVDDALRDKEQMSFAILEDRLAAQEDALDRAIVRLLRIHEDEQELVLPIRRGVEQIRKIVNQAKEIGATYEDRQSQLFNLAGVGLITEIVAHELNRATIHTLSLTKELNVGATAKQAASIRVLEQQLKTLQKRLRSIDPASTAGRQHKEKFDVVEWVSTICQAHEAQFRRHGITFSLATHPRDGELLTNGVRGMYVQVLENLLSNSVYWLDMYAKTHPDFSPAIEVTIDCRKRTVALRDNGPGVEPYRAEDIFQPFVTTKPPRKGKGLGLYISREIAKYNGASLELSDEHTEHTDSLNTFTLSLGE